MRSAFILIFALGAAALVKADSCPGTCLHLDDIHTCQGEIDVGIGLCSGSLMFCCKVPISTTTETPVPTVNSPDCGKRKTTPGGARIVGGVDTEPGEYPWLISLKIFGRHNCGGSILNSRYVISAAHCFSYTSPSYYTVTVGEYKISDKLNSNQVTHKVKRIIIHPDYKKVVGSPGDIALLELEDEIDFESEYANSVCLPEDRTETFANWNCTVSGWGMTNPTVSNAIADIQQKMTGPILSNSQCRSRWGASRILDSHLCQFRDDASACRGDSGGPLHCLANGQFQMVGVVSWGRTNCKDMPAVYTRVTSHLNWINTNIN